MHLYVIQYVIWQYVILSWIKNNNNNTYILNKVLVKLAYVTLSVKTQLKSFFVIFCFLQKIILQMVKNILWKCNIYIFNIDVRSSQRFKL